VVLVQCQDNNGEKGKRGEGGVVEGFSHVDPRGLLIDSHSQYIYILSARTEAIREEETLLQEVRPHLHLLDGFDTLHHLSLQLCPGLVEDESCLHLQPVRIRCWSNLTSRPLQSPHHLQLFLPLPRDDDRNEYPVDCGISQRIKSPRLRHYGQTRWWRGQSSH
jgi:hypothetical protein